MLTRINDRLGRDDEGFSLVELLVVIIVIGILAAIAVPMFMSQRAKAADTAAKSDVTNIGKEIMTFFVDGTVDEAMALTLDDSGDPARYTLTPDGGTVQDLGPETNGVELLTTEILRDPAVKAGDPISRTNWCVGVRAAEGDIKEWIYTANGLAEGECLPR